MTAHQDRHDSTLTRDELLEKYADYARQIAWKWQRRCPQAEYEDLHSEVMLGFISAANRFDRSRNLTFGTFATWWALRYVRLYIANVLSRGAHATRGARGPGVVSLETLGTEPLIPQPEAGPTFGEEWWRDALDAVTCERSRRIVRGWSEGVKPGALAKVLGVSPRRVLAIRMNAFAAIRRHRPQLAEQS